MNRDEEVVIISAELLANTYNSDPQLAADEFNNKIISVSKPAEISEVQKFLFRNGLDSVLSSLNRSGKGNPTPSTPELTAITLFDFFDSRSETIDMSLAVTRSAVDILMDDLVGKAETVPDQAAANAFKITIKALGTINISKADELEISYVTAGKIIEARI